MPEKIIKNTIAITAPKTGELGKNYFYCSNDAKCSTEQVVLEYYENKGYQVMRTEYSFWQGMFVLSFLDELYPQTLNAVAMIDIALEDKYIQQRVSVVRE